MLAVGLLLAREREREIAVYLYHGTAARYISYSPCKSDTNKHARYNMMNRDADSYQCQPVIQAHRYNIFHVGTHNYRCQPLIRCASQKKKQ